MSVRLDKITFGGKNRFVLIAGPCVIESPALAMSVAKKMVEMTKRLKVPYVFKASYDKANRTSVASHRGPGMARGLEILADIKERLNVPILTDVHSPQEAVLAAKFVDIIQIPAFLCRQTDLIVAAAKTGKIVNVKKGQFLAPWDVKGIIKKMEAAHNHKLLLTERGVSFGYNTLVSDFRGLAQMRALGYPVVYDATHSVQQPGGLGHASGGQSEFVPLLSRCAVAAGVDALFIETHPNPEKALSDGPNMLPLHKMEGLLKELIAIDKVIKGQ